MPLKRSRIGYDGTGANGLPVRHYQWEPFGWGCSIKCMAPAKCWAERLAPRAATAMKLTCPKCLRFEPHTHPERYIELSQHRKAAVILTCFHSDIADPRREAMAMAEVLHQIRAAKRHTVVLLTKRPDILAEDARWPIDNAYIGVTIRNQADADRLLPDFLRIPGKKWISYEPAWGGVNWRHRLRPSRSALAEECRGMFGPHAVLPTIAGIILGHDNRGGAEGTGTLEHIRGTIAQCKAAGVRYWTKQVWWKGRLLRASHPAERAAMPSDLVDGLLPWPAPGEND